MLFQILAGSADGSAGSGSGYKNINISVGVFPDFGAGGFIMGLRIGRIAKLVGDKATRQFLGQLFISQDNAESQCLAMGKSIMVYGKMYPFEQTRKQIEQLTADQLQQVAQEVLSKERLSELVYR